MEEKPKSKAGRKPRTYKRAATEALLQETSMDAARYLQTVVRGQKGDPIRCEQCRYMIDQVLGRPRQRTEATIDGALAIANIVVKVEREDFTKIGTKHTGVDA